MTPQPLSDFVSQAAAAGIPDQTLIGMLTAQGWTEKEIYRALASHYRASVGLEVPVKSSSTASAKDAFFYLLIFATLATWTVNLGLLAFTLIGRWLKDPLFPQNPWLSDSSEIASHIAAVLVAYPVYLLVTRAVLREVRANPEKLDSGVRKWLTYLGLVVAAVVVIADLITALEYLLRGEFTSRFFAKVFVVLVLAGGTFFYYFAGLRGTTRTIGGLSRDRLMALVSAAAVIVTLIFGFLNLGTPYLQRQQRADYQRLQSLYRLANALQAYSIGSSKGLPPDLAQVHGESVLDPVTRVPFDYHALGGTHYQLCAVFQTASAESDNVATVDPWRHPQGHFCFNLDASLPASYPPNYGNL